jgi:hypothetical protein
MAYGVYKGDYLRAMRGDPGIFGFLGKAVGGVARGLGGILPGPLGGVARTVGGLLPGGSPAPGPAPGTLPILRSQLQPRAPKSFSGVKLGPLTIGTEREAMEQLGMARKRRRMNVTNPKALRRAIRRQTGFVKLARRALKGTGYTIVSRGSRRPRTVVKESGPGSVTVQ